MNLTLPPRTDGSAPDCIVLTHTTPLVIVGANGAGKTRFADAICAGLGDKAYALSVIEALYTSGLPVPERSAVDRLYMASKVPRHDKERVQTRLERLLGMLMADELSTLLDYKLAAASGHAAEHLPATILDSVIGLYRKTFTTNQVLVEDGQLLFSNTGTTDTFGASRLSDGERAVLYYASAILYAPAGALIAVDSPEMFLHPTTMTGLWDSLEALRPDCDFMYTTHDLEFAASRHDATMIWVQGCDPAAGTWDYRILPERGTLPNEVYLAILGARRPVLFIEGDERSIDWQLYPLIFNEYTVKPLGSCNKVIEATRTFNDLNALHRLRAVGIVDRDRRDAGEVGYLRRKNIMVPDVAEIENLLLTPDVVRAVAEYCGCDAEKVFGSVCKAVLAMFRHDVRQQALQHTRHRVKRTVEYRIDGRFTDIAALERHVSSLLDDINPRRLYEGFCREFHRYVAEGDYCAVLRVYNQKSMLAGSNVSTLCGLRSKEQYIDTILHILRDAGCAPYAARIRQAMRAMLQAPAE